MMKRLKDRIGIVSGASAGIGAACARRPAAEGAHVVVADLPSANNS
jgi:NAD(P)-dependent dehydrogenase (short-subunit alcohol dehydrogenase family)